MKNFKLLLVLLIISTTMIGCSSKNEDTTANVEKTVNNFLTAFKDKKFDSLNNYVENESCPLSQLYVADNKENNLIFDTITKNLTYKVNSITVNGNKATVNLSISNLDMAEVMSLSVSNFLEIGSEKAKEPNFNAEDLLYELIDKYIKEFSNSPKEFSAEFSLVKKGGKWLITESQESTDFYDVITGRYYAYTVGASETFSILSGDPK